MCLFKIIQDRVTSNKNVFCHCECNNSLLRKRAFTQIVKKKKKKRALLEHHEDKLQQELDEFNREREPNVLLYNSY